jgi:hypothetical protein
LGGSLPQKGAEEPGSELSFFSFRHLSGCRREAAFDLDDGGVKMECQHLLHGSAGW